MIEVLTRVRRAKTEAKQSQRSSVDHLAVTAPTDALAALAAGQADLCDAGSIGAISLLDGDAFDCTVILSETT